eukprot:SAG11_NODE_15886_length_563_cov_1.762931_1_plen_32_part_10
MVCANARSIENENVYDIVCTSPGTDGLINLFR